MTHVSVLSCRFLGPAGCVGPMLLEILESHGLFGTAGPSMSHLLSLFPQVSATDEDRGSFGAISYILGSGSGSTASTHFTIDKETGQICTSTALDRDEGLDKFDLTVTATDGVRILLL